MPIQLDLNNPRFQTDFFKLEKHEAYAMMKTFRKLSQLEWDDIYRDSGLNWEAIQSRTGDDGERIFSIRITQKFRAVVQRDKNTMRFLELHPDHDSAY
jgi:hypothetical protein